ncbi:MAG: DnaD domain protein, partial [Peptostreptococcaceae bacterium]
ELFLKNWIKHNKVTSPKVIKCVEKELLYIKSKKLINLFLKECDKYGYSIDIKEANINTTMDTHIDNENTTMDRVCIPITEVDNNCEYGYGEKEKEKQKEKEKKEEEEKEKEASLLADYKLNNFEMMRYLYDSKIGKIDLDVDKALFDIYESVDIHLFKRAIDISIERNKPNIAYIKGIIRKWNDNGIRTLDSLKVLEEKRSLRGDKDNEQRGSYGKSKPTNAYEDEDDGVIYQRPSEEQLDEVRRIMQDSDK